MSSEAKRDLVLFDLDGTLANLDHRRHLVMNGAKRWREFYAACWQDGLNEAVSSAWNAYGAAGYELWIVSGRSDEVQDKTHRWLDEHGLHPHRILMRQARDHQPDVNLKQSWLREGIIPRDRVLCVYDDRASVVAMWREEGLPCFQVAPGDF